MTASAPNGLLAPLANRTFAALWIASIVSNIGTAMQAVGVTWALVQDGANPALVAALQAASSAPLFLAGLPAGVLADIVNRRKLLIAANVWTAVAGASLAAVAFLNGTSPWVLLAATFAIGLGAAFSAPAFRAIMPELATKDALAPAVALNSIGVNIARTIGPALGGVTVAAVGAPGSSNSGGGPGSVHGGDGPAARKSTSHRRFRLETLDQTRRSKLPPRELRG